MAPLQGFVGGLRALVRSSRVERELDDELREFVQSSVDAKIAAGEFLEWARVHGAQRRYGTLKAAVLEPLAAGRSLVINVDVQGVENFRRAAAADPLLARHLATVFIDVPIPELRLEATTVNMPSSGKVISRRASHPPASSSLLCVSRKPGPIKYR